MVPKPTSNFCQICRHRYSDYLKVSCVICSMLIASTINLNSKNHNTIRKLRKSLFISVMKHSLKNSKNHDFFVHTIINLTYPFQGCTDVTLIIFHELSSTLLLWIYDDIKHIYILWNSASLPTSTIALPSTMPAFSYSAQLSSLAQQEYAFSALAIFFISTAQELLMVFVSLVLWTFLFASCSSSQWVSFSFIFCWNLFSFIFFRRVRA